MNQNIPTPAVIATRLLARTVMVPFLLACNLGPTTASAAEVSPQAVHPALRVTRLDCGEGRVPLSMFSDTFENTGDGVIPGVISCYLVQHGNDYLLWDLGLSSKFRTTKPPTAAQSGTPGFSYTASIEDQLRALKVPKERVRFVAVSHNHFDHSGQASDFPDATLVIGAADFEEIKTTPSDLDRWTQAGAKVTALHEDLDVFGDGSVIVLKTPGHTAGHLSLLVRLVQRGPLILTGDLWYQHSQIDKGQVSARYADRAAVLASQARVRAIAKNIDARIVVCHDPMDIDALPGYPAAAE